MSELAARVSKLLLTPLQKSFSHITLPVQVCFPLSPLFFNVYQLLLPFYNLNLKGPVFLYKGYLKLRRAATNECAPKLKLVFTKVPFFGAALGWQAAGLIQI